MPNSSQVGRSVNKKIDKGRNGIVYQDRTK